MWTSPTAPHTGSDPHTTYTHIMLTYFCCPTIPSARPQFVSIFDPSASPQPLNRKQQLRRTPSAPLRGSADLFRGSHIRCDIPFYSAEGIELLGFQRLGTIHLPRIRSGSDPSCSVG